MKKIKVEDAVGERLCHDITAMRDGFKGAAFKRGHIIRKEDIEELLNLGKRTVFVWEERAGEIHEEEAARRMADALRTEGVYYSEVSEGKALMYAGSRGMLRINTELLRQINSIEDITVTTLPDYYPVEKDARLASMRIVPLVTKESRIVRMEELCRGRKLVELKAYHPLRAGVVVTGSEIYTGRIQDKFEPVIREKLKNYPGEILGVTICDDDLDMIVSAAKDYLEAGADFLIFTGGMSVDPDDLTPVAIRMLGAEILTHGVPAQPGNMTLAAYLGEIPILGVPGAAISLPTTVLDVLLPQIYAKEPLTKQELIRLGDGGLCQLCAVCHYPNCTFGRY